MLELRNISKTFSTIETETTALKDVSLTINKGDFIAITGPSGCGKSTLLNIIGLLDKATSGDLLINDNSVIAKKESVLTNIRQQHFGYIFQSFNLIDEITVYENIELPLLYQNVAKEERKKRVEQVLAATNMHTRQHHYPKQLSGGQQQRVAVARALIVEPSVILADEPTGNLDSKHGYDIMNLLCDLNDKGSTIVMVTHSQSHASYANRVIQINDGQVAEEFIKHRKVVNG